MDNSMNQEIKQEWLERLRSDEYEQGTGRLRGDGNKRCCLGVLCDIYTEENENAEWDEEGRFVIKDDGGDTVEQDRKVLPRTVWEWAGLKNHQGAYFDEREASLSQMNDGLDGARQHSFEEIADAIEEEL